jgi:hypothetical protein
MMGLIGCLRLAFEGKEPLGSEPMWAFAVLRWSSLMRWNWSAAPQLAPERQAKDPELVMRLSATDF